MGDPQLVVVASAAAGSASDEAVPTAVEVLAQVSDRTWMLRAAASSVVVP